MFDGFLNPFWDAAHDCGMLGYLATSTLGFVHSVAAIESKTCFLNYSLLNQSVGSATR
jgi:hypothetical protein